MLVDNTKGIHSRYAYNILNFFSDTGGIMGLFTLVLGIFILPISEHSYYSKALKKLYFAKTIETHMFGKKKFIEELEEYQGNNKK